MTAGVTLEEVEALLASGSRRLIFTPPVEDLFEIKRQIYRAKALVHMVMPSIICYNIFLPFDCMLLPKTAGLAIFLHFVVTNWIVVAGVVFRSKPSLIIRELAGVSIPILMAAQILCICIMNEGALTVASYNYLVVMIVIYMNINQRPDFRYASGASFLIAAAYVLFLSTGRIDLSARLVGAGSMASAVYLSLNATWRMERDARYAFVMRLRDRLRCEAAEAEAGRDALTGLFNRRFLAERADAFWSAAEPASSASVIMLDVDHFKDFNDRHGHPAGDLCLKRVAGAVMAVTRSASDIVARYGGEEFIVFLPQTDLCAAIEFAEGIRQAVAMAAIPHEAVGANGRVTVSLGVAAGSVAQLSMSDLIAGADAALYAAKRNGRNCIWPPAVGAEANVTVLSWPDRASA